MPLPIRTKTVTLDGANYLISPLTHQAATEYADLEAKDKKDVRFSVIAFSLNRAGVENVTEEQLRAESDALTTRFLFEEILKFSGLKTVEKTPGEAAAPVSESGSAPYAAV